MRKRNPPKFDRCVKDVKAKGGAVSPYAVCTAAGTRNKGKRRKNIIPPIVPLPTAISQTSEAVQLAKFLRTGKLNKGKRKRNPADESAVAFEQFQGRPSEEQIVIERQIHYHRHLAAAGKLEKLVVVSRQGDRVTLSDFKGAVLAFNEKGTQLFVEGGDQRVNLREFGIATPHEMETLGDVTDVEYFTTKDHLGSDGGTAIYHHKFKRPYPELVYDVPNRQLTFSGGKYVILPEGIDN